MKTVKMPLVNPFVRAAERHKPMETETGLRRCYDYRLFCVFDCGEDCLVRTETFSEPLSRGTVMVFPPLTAYDFSGEMTMGIINFDVTRECDFRQTPLCPPPVGSFRPELVYDGNVAEGFEKPLIFRGGQAMIEKIREILVVFAKSNEFSDSGTSGRMKVLLTDLLNDLNTVRDAETELADSVMAYIRMHGTQLSVNDDIADHFGYNKVYLGSVLRRKKGVSLHKAVIDAKVVRAQYMLASTADSVESIAEKCGFSSRSYFCTAFKASTGLTPLEFRTLDYQPYDNVEAHSDEKRKSEQPLAEATSAETESEANVK